MSPNTLEAGQKLESMRGALIDAIVDRHYQLRAELTARYGDRGRQKCREDAGYHLTYLGQALSTAAPSLFRDYVAWAKVMLAGRGIPSSDLADNLRVTSLVLRESMPVEEASAACGCIEAALADLPGMATALPSHIIPKQFLSELAESYLAALLASDRRTASSLILCAIKNGTSIKNIYMHVFQRSQEEIGRLWQTNQITVAQEHCCTAATQMIMSQLYPQIFAEPRVGRHFVGACVAGDLHEIGIRMVADFFEMDGWDTDYLGASIPIPDLLRTLQDRKPDVVGISATITPHISAVAKVITAIRGHASCAHVKILVGGYPFHIVQELWRQVGRNGDLLGTRRVLLSWPLS